ncbi:MAG TPA: PEPxxWA-CTERM sorting domain-containing protein [Phenylobacterium sp.]|uniref:PEPxxWA-CTERM sorting domain-containing protein n=1 Tax=Phenylobacterium sp. TaxID=1871053 RepID=UPI002F92A28A
MKKLLGTLAGAAVLAWSGVATVAHAAVLLQGVIAPYSEEDPRLYVGGAWLGGAPGFYRFTSDATIAAYDDLSATLMSREYKYSDDFTAWDGAPHFWPIPWEASGVSAPVFTQTPNGFTLYIELPPDTQTHSNGCYFYDKPCGYWQYEEYRLDLYMIMLMEPGSAGKTYTLEHFDRPPTAVPEPATWAMMIIGFGLVGSGLRRARGQRRAPLRSLPAP